MARKKKYGIPKGQEEITAAIVENNPYKLWKLVKYIGYKDVPSINMRKIIFFRAWEEYDYETNTNFVAYYSSCVRYAGLDYFNRMNSVLVSSKRAHKSYNKKLDWEEKTDKIVNQGENILQNFWFPNPLYK